MFQGTFLDPKPLVSAPGADPDGDLHAMDDPGVRSQPDGHSGCRLQPEAAETPPHLSNPQPSLVLVEVSFISPHHWII